jgi:hypothetical protein
MTAFIVTHPFIALMALLVICISAVVLAVLLAAVWFGAHADRQLQEARREMQMREEARRG